MFKKSVQPMKKISLICAVALAGLSLTACGNPSQKKNTTSKQTSSKVVKKHHKKVKRSKKKVNKSKHASSSSAVSASSQQNQQQQTQANNGQQQASQNNGQGLPPATDAYDFANKYGVSPALWKMQHYGMSAKDALMSMPKNMRTTGENQDVTGIQQGYVGPNTLGPKN